MIKIGIVGGTGYTGVELVLVNLALLHEEVSEMVSCEYMQGQTSGSAGAAMADRHQRRLLRRRSEGGHRDPDGTRGVSRRQSDRARSRE